MPWVEEGGGWGGGKGVEERCMRGNFSAKLYLLSRTAFSARRCGPIFDNLR